MWQRILVLAIALASPSVVNADSPKDETPAEKEFKRLGVPKELTPTNSKILFLLRAEGVQKYTAVGGERGTLKWSGFVEPAAVLFDYDTGEAVGSHSKGPVWESKDGSKVQGEPIVKIAGPNPSAVDWLLLKAKETSGKGRFENVSFISRVDTWAGRAPAAPPDNARAVAEVRYQATYVFWGSNRLELKDGKAAVESSLTAEDMKAHDHYFRVYSLKMARGRTYRLTIESNDFTGYLRLENPNGKWLMSGPDTDGSPKVGSTWTFSLNFQPENEGLYRLTVTSKWVDSKHISGKGRFTLTVQEKPASPPAR